jgi:transposase
MEVADAMTIDDRAIFGAASGRAGSSHGKRRFDPVEKERLIEAALDPGLSVAGLALAHGINANKLRKWVQLRKGREAAERALTVMPAPAPSAFVPVVEAAPIARRQVTPVRLTLPRMRLKASLPNGMRLELEDADTLVLSAMIEALGRCDVPTG